ncbi:MAG: hypothetical protein AAF270_03365 [Pseudomonadota bacterium]
MHAYSTSRLSRVLLTAVSCFALAGCFGTGDGPEPIAGTPAPPAAPLPPGFCDGISFEDQCPATAITNFAGGASDVIDNPDASGLNTSDKVVQMRKFADQVFGGTTLSLPTGFNFSNGEAFTMKVWSPRQVPVLFKFEGVDKERELPHTGSGMWEELCFDFTGDTMGPAATGITVIFDITVLGDADNDPNNWTFYYDDIQQVADCSGGSGGPALPVDFEADPASYNFGMDGGFGGGASDVIANPDQSGLNTTAQTARMQKFAGEVFGGSTLSLGSNVDFSAGEAFRVKVWSPRVVPVLFKFEGLDRERSLDHSGGSTWQELCFDFTGDTSGNPSSAITFIFDIGVNGDATNDPNNWTFYYDEIEQVASCNGGGGGGGTAAIDFESAATGANFTWTVFENADDPALQIIANPDASGINTSATVAAFTARVGGQPFAGAVTSDLPTFTLDATNSTVTIKVWKPIISDVGIKFENAAGGSTGEIRVPNTVTNQWEELTFDFSGVIGDPNNTDITGLVVFPDYAARSQDNVVYFDDITFSGGGGGGGGADALSVDFEADPATYDFGPDGGFGGGASDVIANPDQSGLNTTAQTARMQKFAAEPFGGSTLALANEVDFSAGEAFLMKVWATRAVPVLFKFEGLDRERTVNHSGSGGWEELCFDFTGDTAGNPSSAITFIFDNGVNGDAANDASNWTFYYDEIEQVADCGVPPASFPIDFEADPTSYNFGPAGGFGGGASSVITNPDQSGLNTTAQTARMQKFAAEPFGGSTLALDGNVDFSGGEVFRMKVWATRSVPVLFKFEGLDRERTVNHTGSGGWEELCFDFTGDTAGPQTNAITFIFDNGVNGDAANDADNWTFYYDEIEQVASCGGGGGGGPTAPITTDFEAGGTFTFSDFGGGVAMTAGNPDATGINTSATVAQFQKFAGEVFGGSTLELPGPVDFSQGEAYQIKVYATREVDVLFKLDGLDQERTVTHTGSGWEQLCFDFTGTTSGNPAVSFTFIFDNGTAGEAATDPGNWTFYADDIVQSASCPTVPETASLPIDFEQAANTYVFRDGGGFGGGLGSVVANPDSNGNTSAQVARMEKFAGEVFGGTTLDLGGTINLAANTVFSMNVLSSRTVPVLFKLEGGPIGEITANHGGTGWEQLCFDFGALSGNGVDGITFIFDNGVAGAAATDPGNWTFYFDDIARGSSCPGSGGGGGTPTGAAIDFESPTTGAGFTWSVFENVDNPALEIIANPDATGANTSGTVARFTARQAGQPFAGTITNDLPTFTLDASNAFVTIKVWKSVISDVGIKFENGTQGSTGEIRIPNTVTNQWEELTFDFTGVIGDPNNTDITGFIVFPDFNDSRTQDNIVLFDEISFGDGS